MDATNGCFKDVSLCDLKNLKITKNFKKFIYQNEKNQLTF